LLVAPVGAWTYRAVALVVEDTVPPTMVKAVEEEMVKLEVLLGAPLIYTVEAPAKVATVVVLTVGWLNKAT